MRLSVFMWIVAAVIFAASTIFGCCALAKPQSRSWILGAQISVTLFFIWLSIPMCCAFGLIGLTPLLPAILFGLAFYFSRPQKK